MVDIYMNNFEKTLINLSVLLLHSIQCSVLLSTSDNAIYAEWLCYASVQTKIQLWTNITEAIWDLASVKSAVTK